MFGKKTVENKKVAIQAEKLFDLGQSDSEILASFEGFVQEMEHLNRKSPLDHGVPAYVLMGADDRYRWCGEGGRPAP